MVGKLAGCRYRHSGWVYFSAIFKHRLDGDSNTSQELPGKYPDGAVFGGAGDDGVIGTPLNPCPPPLFTPRPAIVLGDPVETKVVMVGLLLLVAPSSSHTDVPSASPVPRGELPGDRRVMRPFLRRNSSAVFGS